MTLEVEGKKKIKNWKKVTEWISLIAVFYYVAIRFYDSSRFTFAFFNLPRKLTVSIPIAIIAIIRFVPCVIEEWKNKKNRKKIAVKLFLSVLFVLPCLYIAYKYDYGSMAYLAIIPFCLYNVDTDKVIKIFTATISLLLITTIICSLSGIIDNRINASIGETHEGNLRGCYGIASATDLAAYFVFILSFLWCAQENRRDLWSLLFLICLILLIAWSIYTYTSTWTSIILCLVLVGFIVFEHVERGIHTRKKTYALFSKAVEIIVTWIFPFLGIAFYGLTWLYGHGNSFALKIDAIGHNRLEWAWRAFQKYGIHPFGALTPQNGRGGDLIYRWEGVYDFLDSTFALFLIRYGWVLTILVGFLWVWMTKRALKNGRKRIAYTMAIIALHCFSEHHFPELNYNILLAVPFCSLMSKQVEYEGVEKQEIHHSCYVWISWLTGAFLSGFIILLSPIILPRMRTAFEIYGWTKGEYSNFIAVFIVLLCLVLLVLSWKYITKILVALAKKKKIRKSNAFCLICIMLFFICIHLLFSSVINTSKYNKRLEAETPAIQLILSSNEEPVYASQLEELYKQEFNGIFSLVDSPETLSRNRMGTVIVKKELESFALLHTGAVYAEISDYSSIYTYDDSVVNALQKAEYQVHGYYFTEREIELKTIAELNGAEINEVGGIELHRGLDIVEEPNLSLFNGKYITTFDLSVAPEILDQFPSTNVCDLEITTYYRTHSIKRVTVQTNDFDETGHLCIHIGYDIVNDNLGLGNAGVGFNVYPMISMTVNKISYRSNPTIDTWQEYDEYNRLIKERYYNVDGLPISLPEGQYGITYQYDKGLDSWVLCQYLDEKGRISNIHSGYAQIKRIYNSSNRLIEEQFLNADGNLCINESGYAFCRRKHDGAGNVAIYQYFGINAEPIIMNNGYAELHREYNAKRQKVKDTYYGTNGRPMTLQKGQAGVIYEYDEDENINRFIYIGLDGKPILLTSGYADLHRVYNEQKQIIREEYYDTEGNMIIRQGGYSSVEYSYNFNGELIKECYYDLNDKLINIIEY